jgi:ribosomal protein S20
MKTFQKKFFADLEKEVAKSVNKAVQNAVMTVVNEYLIENKY